MVDFGNYSEDEEQGQKQTHLTFPNPKNPEASGSYASEETMHEHFKSAMNLKRAGINRRMAVGDFMTALSEALEEDSVEPLEEFIDNFED